MNDWTDLTPDDEKPDTVVLPYPGEGDPRSMGMSRELYAEWAAPRARLSDSGRRKAKDEARATRTARWRQDRARTETARTEKKLETDPRHTAELHALNRLADEWISNEHH